MKIAITTLLSIIFSTSVFATQNLSASSLILGKFDSNSRETRKTLAIALKKQVDAFDKLIPNPTPDELNWIENEEKATRNDWFSSRYRDFIESPELQKSRLKNSLESMQYYLENILRDIAHKNTPEEMYNWTSLSTLMLDSDRINDAILILQRNNKFPSDATLQKDRDAHTGLAPDNNYPGGHNSFYNTEAQGIISYIVIPYLKNEALQKNLPK
jgi:hypothetical protein